MSERWWIELDGKTVFGPCITRDMAFSVRFVIEHSQARTDLSITRDDDREGWAVWQHVDTPDYVQASPISHPTGA